MEIIRLKKAIIFDDKIVLLRKKGEVVINIEDIDKMEYVRLTVLNYLAALPFFDGWGFNKLYICMKKKAEYAKLYTIKMKYKEVVKLVPAYDRLLNIK